MTRIVADGRHLGDDVGLFKYKAEYTASIMLQQALSAYYDPASSNQVVGHGRKAMALLRQILIPPTKEPEPKTPPRKVAGPTTRSAKKPVAIKTVSRPTRTPARAGARAVSDSKAIKGSPKVLGEKKKDDASEPIFEDIDRMYALLSTSLGIEQKCTLADAEALSLRSSGCLATSLQKSKRSNFFEQYSGENLFMWKVRLNLFQFESTLMCRIRRQVGTVGYRIPQTR